MQFMKLVRIIIVFNSTHIYHLIVIFQLFSVFRNSHFPPKQFLRGKGRAAMKQFATKWQYFVKLETAEDKAILEDRGLEC